MSKNFKNWREPWRKIGKAHEYKITIDGENYIHNVPEFKAFDYFSSCRKKEQNIPIYKKIAQYAKEEGLKVDKDDPPMPLVSAEKYAQLIKRAKEELGQGWGLNEKIYIKNIVDIAASPYTNIRPDKGSNFRKGKKETVSTEESSEEKDIENGEIPKKTKHCPRISVEYLLNKDKNGCDYVLNSYQNTIYKISEYLRHDKDTCYIPKISGFIREKGSGGEKEGDKTVSTHFIDGSKQRRFTLNGISGFFIYPLKSEYEIVIENEVPDYEKEVIESEEESEEESDSDDGINVKRITINNENYLIEDGAKIPRIFRDNDDQDEIGSWWGDGTIRGDKDIEIILDKIKINNEEYFVDTGGILYDNKLKKIGKYSKGNGILTKDDTEIKVKDVVNYVIHRDSNTMSTLASMDSIIYLEIMKVGDKTYYLEDDMVYDAKHNYLGLYDKHKNIIENNHGEIIEDFKPKPNTDMKKGIKISGVKIIDKTGELTEEDKKHYDEIRKKFSAVKTLETNKWIKRESRKHPGKYYYYNTVTKESTWKKPDNFKGGGRKKTHKRKKYRKKSNKK